MVVQEEMQKSFLIIFLTITCGAMNGIVPS